MDGRGKPLMDRKVIDVSSLSLSFCLFLWLSTYLPTYLPMYPSISLSLSLFVCLSVCLLISPSIYPSTYLSTYLPIYLSIHPSVYLPIYLSIYLPTYLSIYLPIYLSIYRRNHPCNAQLLNHPALLRIEKWFFFFELNNVKNETILRDFFNFQSWQHQKRSNSARLPSKIESCMQRWRPRTNAFCDFSSPPV